MKTFLQEMAAFSALSIFAAMVLVLISVFSAPV